MDLLELSMPTPEEDLALDEGLLLEREERCRSGEESPETLRLWEAKQYYVVLGVAGKIREEVRLDACRASDIPVLRRHSGGGTVVQGPGCLNYSLILSVEDRPELQNFTRSYRVILGQVADALGRAGAGSHDTREIGAENIAVPNIDIPNIDIPNIDIPNIDIQGISDLTARDLKFSGNAQKRKGTSVLHHGTLLYDFDFGVIATVLSEPEVRPEYRGARRHEDFLLNLPLSRAELRDRLVEGFGAHRPRAGAIPPLEALIETKYGNSSWTERF